MLGIDTLNEWLALIGCVFVLWFLIMTLFAPHIPYKLHTGSTARRAVHLRLSNVTLASVITIAASRC